MSLSKEEMERYEWYDNSTLNIVNTCKRKAYFQKLYDGHGVADPVGPGALLGTAIHAGIATAQTLYGQPLLKRKVAAARTFDRIYHALLGDAGAEPPRDWDNALRLLNDYLDYWAFDDELFRPVEPELGLAILVSPEKQDPPGFVEPFVYKCRLDGLLERVQVGDWCIRETKTTSQSPKLEMARLRNARQPRGYLYTANEVLKDRGESKRVMGVLADIIYVNKTKREFVRDFISINPVELWQWRYGTILLVEEWRKLMRTAMFQPMNMHLAAFYKNTMVCTLYNTTCSFYDPCYFNNASILDDRPRNEWDPLAPPKGEV